MSALWSKEDKDVINLGKGHPNPVHFSLKHLEDALKTASASPASPSSLMQYGPMQGSLRFRTQISDWLKAATGRPDAQPGPEHILATTGSGPAMSVIAQLYTKPGENVFVDAPGYFLAYYTFADCGVNVVNVPTDGDGMDVAAVEALIAGGTRPSLVYTVPIGNNPTGVAMSEARKRRLVQLSHEHGFKIAADEVYQFLHFATDGDGEEEGGDGEKKTGGKGTIPTSLFEFDNPDNPSVLALNSFSKLLGPGLRMGWVTTHAAHMARLLDCGALQSGGGFNPFMGELVAELLDNGFVKEQVVRVRKAYASNSRILCDAIDQHLRPALEQGEGEEAETLTYHTPTGGFFCFVSLPKRFEANKLLKQAKQCGVSFFAGQNSSPDKKEFTNCVRLCFAFHEADVLVEGVKRLAEAVRMYEE